MKRIITNRCQQHGVSFVELLMVVGIIAVSVVPITHALQTSMQVAREDLKATVNHYRLISKLEGTLALPFATLSAQALGPSTPSSYSDPVATPDRCLVFISTYDADNADADNDPFTGTDPDFLWVGVEIEGRLQSYASLKSNP